MLIVLAGCVPGTSGAQPATTTTADPPLDTSFEGASLVAECMHAKGVEVNVVDGPTAGWEYDNRVVTESEFDSARQECTQELVASNQIRLAAERDLGAVYHALVEARQCLEDLGFVISSPPSEETWIETQGATWNPLDELHGRLTRGELADVHEQCGIS